MAPNRITSGGAMLATLLMVAILAGCGGGGSSSTAPAATTTAPATGTATDVSTPTPSREHSADATLLDKVLSRQEAAVEAFAKVGPALPARLAHVTAYFRAQEQEHVDAVLKALRGLQSPSEPTPEPVDASGLKGARGRLVFLYEIEGATIDEELSAISKLEASWPRSLLASIVADQAQHLTLLRRALGAGRLAQVPAPFENGTFPPPVG
jgi:hypothetical protein